MWLVTTSVRTDTQNYYTDDHPAAVAAAKAFVGEHNPIDSASSRPAIRTFPDGTFTLSRSTSFGIRYARVAPLPQLPEPA